MLHGNHKSRKTAGQIFMCIQGIQGLEAILFSISLNQSPKLQKPLLLPAGQDILYSKIDKTTKKTKALGLIGAALYIGLALSYFFGVSGEIVLNVKSRRKWNKNTGMRG